MSTVCHRAAAWIDICLVSSGDGAKYRPTAALLCIHWLPPFSNPGCFGMIALVLLFACVLGGGVSTAARSMGAGRPLRPQPFAGEVFIVPLDVANLFYSGNLLPAEAANQTWIIRRRFSATLALA